MKRVYSKPVMQVEHYSVNNAVATGCYEETTTVFPAQTVNCVINGYENIFNTDQTGSKCENDADDGHLGTVNGKYAFVWYNGSVKSSGTPDTAELTVIEKAIYSKAVGEPGWHAGYVSSEEYKKMNSTS